MQRCIQGVPWGTVDEIGKLISLLSLCVVNPYIYGFMNTNFQHELLQMSSCLRCSCKNWTDKPSTTAETPRFDRFDQKLGILAAEILHRRNDVAFITRRYVDDTAYTTQLG